MSYFSAFKKHVALALTVCACNALPAVADTVNPPALKTLAYGSNSAQQMDVYEPGGKPNNAPILLIVHGGGWMFGDKQSAAALQNKLAYWRPKGYVIISIDYRLLPEADPLAQAHDVAKAIRYVQNYARNWGGSADKLIVMGHSAGAHLIDLLAADSAIQLAEGLKPWLGTVSLDSGALDVTQIMNAPHLGLYDKAFGSDPAYWQKVSPTLKLSHALRPILMVCSSQRRMSCLQSRQFASKAMALGGQVTVLPEDLTHAAINQTLGTPGDYTAAVASFLNGLGLP